MFGNRHNCPQVNIEHLRRLKSPPGLKHSKYYSEIEISKFVRLGRFCVHWPALFLLTPKGSEFYIKNDLKKLKKKGNYWFPESVHRRRLDIFQKIITLGVCLFAIPNLPIQEKSLQ